MNGEDAWPREEVADLLRRALESAAEGAVAAGASPGSVAAYVADRMSRLEEAARLEEKPISGRDSRTPPRPPAPPAV
jgi:hypothetical protein